MAATVVPRRTPIARPADLAKRIADTETTISLFARTSVGGQRLRALYPSPAALQLYVLDDRTALNSKRASGATAFLYRYVAQPRSPDQVLLVYDALRNASRWLGEDLQNAVYDRDYGMRREYRELYRLLRQQTVYELTALLPGKELTQARMARVAEIWNSTRERPSASRESPQRLARQWQARLAEWNKAYNAALSGAGTPEEVVRLQQEFDELVAAFRRDTYPQIFLDVLEQTRDEDAPARRPAVTSIDPSALPQLTRPPQSPAKQVTFPSDDQLVKREGAPSASVSGGAESDSASEGDVKAEPGVTPPASPEPRRAVDAVDANALPIRPRDT